MVELQKDTQRAEFLKKSSPIADKNRNDQITPPPLFSEFEKSSILGDSNDIKNERPKTDLGKLAFWKDWKEKHYTYASVGLALLLVGYVGVSVSGLGSNDTSLNATLTVPEVQEQLAEENNEVEEDQVINSEVIDSSIVIEDIKNDSSVEEPDDITEYILESYNF